MWLASMYVYSQFSIEKERKSESVCYVCNVHKQDSAEQAQNETANCCFMLLNVNKYTKTKAKAFDTYHMNTSAMSGDCVYYCCSRTHTYTHLFPFIRTPNFFFHSVPSRRLFDYVFVRAPCVHAYVYNICVYG